MSTSTPSFGLGKVVMTANAMSALMSNGIDAIPFVARHAACDFGDIDQEDKEQNLSEIASFNEVGFGRVMSVYESKGVKFWIISDLTTGGSYTTILLPSDY